MKGKKSEEPVRLDNVGERLCHNIGNRRRYKSHFRPCHNIVTTSTTTLWQRCHNVAVLAGFCIFTTLKTKTNQQKIILIQLDVFASAGRNVRFLKTPVLRFALLSYYQRTASCISWIERKILGLLLILYNTIMLPPEAAVQGCF